MPTKAQSPISTVEHLDHRRTYVAVALYNDIRTSLEASGWTEDLETTTPGYWWRHPDHPGAFSMSSAHGRWRLDLEAQKAERIELDETVDPEETTGVGEHP